MRSPCRRAVTAPEQAATGLCVPPRLWLLSTTVLCSPARSGHKPQPGASRARCHQPRDVTPCPSPGRERKVGASCCVTLQHTAGCVGTPVPGRGRAEAQSCRPSLGAQSISRRCEAGSRGPGRGTAEFLLVPCTFRGCTTHRAPSSGHPQLCAQQGWLNPRNAAGGAQGEQTIPGSSVREGSGSKAHLPAPALPCSIGLCGSPRAQTALCSVSTQSKPTAHVGPSPGLSGAF